MIKIPANHYKKYKYIRTFSLQRVILVLFLFLFIFFYLGFTTHQDYFTHFEPSQSLGGAKTGDPREKTPDHPQAELGLSHMWPELGSNP